MPELRTHTLARVAYEKVTARKKISYEEKYSALAHKLPGMILQNGLAQATGFLLAKGDPEHRALLDDLTTVMHSIGAIKAHDREQLHREIINANLQQTLLLTRRALEASGWIKRYVQGALGIDSTGDANTQGENT